MTKGQIPWNKGLKLGCNPKHSELIKQLWRKGIYKNRIIKYNDIEFKRKHKQNTMSAMNKPETLEKLRLAKLGTKLSKKTREKQRYSAIKYIKKTRENIKFPCIGKHETEILDFIEDSIPNFKIERQYEVKGYFIDGYNKNRNIAFEVDESFHKKQVEKDIQRENIIKNELNCMMVRIPTLI